jgi:hypothetical protein
MDIYSPGDHQHEDRGIGVVEIEVELQWDEDREFDEQSMPATARCENTATLGRSMAHSTTIYAFSERMDFYIEGTRAAGAWKPVRHDHR